jgi:hypothetical protein
MNHAVLFSDKQNNLLTVEKNKSRNFVLFFFCVLISTVFLAICSKSSFLYPFNDWGDANCFLTVGKSLLRGKVLYRDIFDQKGPLLYLIHGFAGAISNNSFLGVYIVEVICFSCFLWVSAKIIRLYLPVKSAYFMLPIIAAIILSSPALCHGDSAEELCLPSVAVSIYSLLRYYKLEYPAVISYKQVLLNGVIAGCILLIKFNLLGFQLVWILSIVLVCLIQKKLGRAVKTTLVFLSGIIALLLPWLIYFFLNHALGDFYMSYFYDNIFVYSKISELTIFDHLFGRLFNIMIAFLENFQFSLFIIIGLAALLITQKYLKSLIGRLSLFIGCLALMAGIFAGDIAYQYYGLLLSVFSVFGLIFIVDLIYSKLRSHPIKSAVWYLSVIAVTGLSLVFAWFSSPNIYLIGERREDMAQYKFKAIIMQTDHPTLLNYGFLDFGEYTICNIDPTCKYFCGLNIRLPEIQASQDAFINEKKIDYVLTRNSVPPFILKNYSVVSKQDQYFEGKTDTYYLLKRLP